MLEDILTIIDCGHMRATQYHAMSRARPEDYLLMWVWSGCGHVYMGSQERRATSGDLLCLRPGISHTYYADPDRPWEIFWARFTGAAAEPYVDRILPDGSLWRTLGHDPRIRDHFTELIVAFAAKSPSARQFAEASLYGQLGRILYRLESQASTAHPLALDELYRVQHYIHEHLAEPMTLESLADRAYMSPSHFTRQFKQVFDLTPIQYLIQQRIGRASLLLEETAMPIKQICRAVGYDDPYYFSRLFKKITGQNPTDYRRACRLKQDPGEEQD